MLEGEVRGKGTRREGDGRKEGKQGTRGWWEGGKEGQEAHREKMVGERKKEHVKGR